MRALILALALSGCGAELPPQQKREPAFVSKGYVARSLSLNASRGSIGFTVTFDNKYLPQTGGSCIGIDVCTVE